MLFREIADQAGARRLGGYIVALAVLAAGCAGPTYHLPIEIDPELATAIVEQHESGAVLYVNGAPAELHGPPRRLGGLNIPPDTVSIATVAGAAHPGVVWLELHAEVDNVVSVHFHRMGLPPSEVVVRYTRNEDGTFVARPPRLRMLPAEYAVRELGGSTAPAPIPGPIDLDRGILLVPASVSADDAEPDTRDTVKPPPPPKKEGE